jgi:RHS repeat-associated protein
MAVGGGGGTGIVRVAYATGALIGTGGIVTTSGSNTIHTFTTSGTFTVSQPTSTNSNPVITLNGSELIDKNVGDTWTEPGYSATDAEDGNLTASVTATGSVNTAVAGIYQLVYDVMDLQGAHAARVTRTVVVNSVNNYLQNSTYAYDANGNITQIVDASGTHGAKTANYTYDDLNRLIEASITNVPTGQTAYDQTYAYNAIGNITNKSDIGDYIYTGSSGTNYANPHAATTINGATNTYDKDGNLLTDGTLVNTWDYRDQLIQTVTGSTTSAYWYDHMGQRVKQSVIATTTTTTYYPNRLYNISGSTSTKNIFLLDGTLITTVTGTGTSTAISYIHTDHLGSISVATDQDGNIKDFTDYYPYGSSRLDEKSGADISRKYIGQEFDGVTALSYLNARYYDGRRGQFVSQDPVFWENSLNQNLKNPQSLNSYSYAENNPIVKSDPSGKCVGPLVAVCIGGGVGAAGGIISQALSDYSTGEFGQRTWQENMETYGVAVVSGATVGAGTAAAILAAPVGIAGTMLVSGTAGTLTAGTTYLGNRVLGQSTDLANLVVGSGMSALTAGTLKNFPQVSGRNPNFNTRAFYTGAHAQRQAAEELFSNGVNMFGQAVNRFVSSQNYSTGSSIGGASLSSLAQQLQSLVGSLNSLVSSLSNSR